MPVNTSSELRDWTETIPRPAKRSRKSDVFVEYQPAGPGTRKERPIPSKRKTGAAPSKNLSCGECRRLKLKCDRVFPCQACIRRGCQGICPNGSLVSGKGTRYVLASTEQLHEKVSRMSDRIRVLENALQSLYEEHLMCPARSRPFQSAASRREPSATPTHPLLQGDKLLIKNQLELYDDQQEANSARSSVRFRRMDERDEQVERMSEYEIENGRDRNGTTSEDFERDTNGSSASTLRNSADITDPPNQQLRAQLHQNTPSSVVSKLSSVFLAVWKTISIGQGGSAEIAHVKPNDLTMVNACVEILEMFPAREEAERLCGIAQEFGFYILNYILQYSELAGIMDDVYNRRRRGVSMVNAALLFILLGIGLRLDCFNSNSSDDGRAVLDTGVENYINASRAAMTLQAFGTDPEASGRSELRIMQYHYLLTQYLSLLSSHMQDRQQTKDAMDILISLAKAVRDELHIESSYSKYDAEEQDGRRIFFYEILSVVGDLCLAFDQPTPFLSVEISQPSCRGDLQRFPTQLEASYYESRRAFYVNCFKPLLDMRSAPSSAFSYSDIVELDCKIRTFPFPPAVLQDYIIEQSPGTGAAPSPLRHKLLQFVTSYRVNSLLLHLHRKFLQQCLSSQSSVLAHPYFASTIATSRSAWVLIRICDSMHREYPDLLNRLILPWYNVLCAASALFILIERIPYCPLAPYSLRELIRATDVLDRASSMHSPMPERTAPIVRQFAAKGRENLQRWKQTLASEFLKDPLLQARVDYCAARFDAITKRIKREGVPKDLSLSMLPDNGSTNDSITDGLEIWDMAHPDIGELLTKLPGCTIDGDTPDKLLWNTVHAPLHEDQQLETTDSAISRTPLVEFFDALDHHLRRRPEYFRPENGDGGVLGAQPLLDASAMLHDMFPDDLELDWATLTDALVAAPTELMNAVPSSGWTGQWDWRDYSLPNDGLDVNWNWNGITGSFPFDSGDV